MPFAMAASALPTRSGYAKLESRPRPALRAALPGRCIAVRVNAVSNVPSAGVPPTDPRLPKTVFSQPTIEGQGPVPPVRPTMVTEQRSASTPSRGGSGGAGGAGYGGSGGSGGSGNRPAGGSSGGSGLPGGWSWDRLLLTLLGIALAVPAWRYLNRRFLMKPEPEHTLAKVEDKAAEIKTKGAVHNAVSNVKHATVDPVVHAVQHVTHTDAKHRAEHKLEHAGHKAGDAAHDLGKGTERTANKVGKDAKEVASATKHSIQDAASAVSHKAHEAAAKTSHAAHEAASRTGHAAHSVKSKVGHGIHKAGEKVGDAVEGVEHATAKGTKNFFEGIKGAATVVGRKMHLVADGTEKGIRKGADAAEYATGVKGVSTPETSTGERKVYYVTGGVLVGTGVLAALYYWDRKGGDLKGKLSKLQDRTKEVADQVQGKARDLARGANEPAGPKVSPPPKPSAPSTKA